MEFEIRTGKFGQYFYNKTTGDDLSLASVLYYLEKGEVHKQQLAQANERIKELENGIREALNKKGELYGMEMDDAVWFRERRMRGILNELLEVNNEDV